MTHTETITAARAAIAANAALYTPRQTVHWIIWEDENGDGDEYDGKGYHQNLASDTPIEEGDYFCENCIEGVLAGLKDDPDAERPEGFERFSYREYDMPEEETFVTCAKCGHHIECSMIWSEQEIEEWQRDDPVYWSGILSDPGRCWELSQLLAEDYGATEKFPAETLAIAERVLAASKILKND